MLKAVLYAAIALGVTVAVYVLAFYWLGSHIPPMINFPSR